MTDNDPLIALIVLVFFYFTLEYFHGSLFKSKPAPKPTWIADIHSDGLLEFGATPMDLIAEIRRLRLGMHEETSSIHSVFCMRMACNHGSIPDAADVLHWEYCDYLWSFYLDPIVGKAAEDPHGPYFFHPHPDGAAINIEDDMRRMYGEVGRHDTMALDA